MADQHTCSRCSDRIPPGEIAAKTGDYWLCESCWKLWSVLRSKVVREALAGFVSGSKP